MNIAICDDEENIRIYIRKLIQKQEPFCKITEFSSGKELLVFPFSLPSDIDTPVWSVQKPAQNCFPESVLQYTEKH